MLLSSQTVSRLALCLAVAGLLALMALLQFAEPKELALAELNESFLDQTIKVNGFVQSRFEAKGTLFFTLTDLTVSHQIKCVKFSPTPEQKALVFKGAEISLKGKLERYKGELEIIVEEII